MSKFHKKFLNFENQEQYMDFLGQIFRISWARYPDFLGQILADLTKMKFSLRKKLSPAIILDGIELVCGAAGLQQGKGRADPQGRLGI